MRALRILLALIGAGLAAPLARAQQTAAPEAVTVPAPVAKVLDSLSQDPNGITVNAADLASGARTIGPKEHLTGSIATWKGPLTVLGTVDGNAVAIGGDVTIEKGARVRGDAVSIGGSVVMHGGTVDGETRSLSAITVGPARPAPLTPAQSMRRSVSLSAGWYLVLALIGFGVLLVARPNLEAVADAVRVQTMRSFLIGLLGQLAVAPLFTLLVVALVITIIGIIAVPFAVVGYGAAVSGALALGFLATAYLAGQAIAGERNGNGDRSLAGSLQPLLIGLSLFLVLWIAGTAFPWTGAIGLSLRFLAVLITWIAVTTGVGAVIVTRAGTRAVVPPAQVAPAPTAELEWQTPTPVSGVAAARRPTPAARRAGGAQ